MSNSHMDFFIKVDNWYFQPGCVCVCICIFQFCPINLADDTSLYLNIKIYAFPLRLLSKITICPSIIKSMRFIIQKKFIHS